MKVKADIKIKEEITIRLVMRFCRVSLLESIFSVYYCKPNVSRLNYLLIPGD